MTEREGLLSAVRARLARVAAARDLSPVLETDAIFEARSLAGALDDNGDETQAWFLLGWLHWYRFQALPKGQDHEDLDSAVEMFFPCFAAGTVELPEFPQPLLPLLAERAVPIALNWLEQGLNSDDPQMISAVVDLWQRILAATPEDDASQAECLSNLGAALVRRFEQTGNADDLGSAIEASRSAVAILPSDSPNRASMLSNLGNALLARFERAGSLVRQSAIAS